MVGGFIAPSDHALGYFLLGALNGMPAGPQGLPRMRMGEERFPGVPCGPPLIV